MYILDAGKFYKRARQEKNYDFLSEMELDLDHLPENGPADPKEIIKIDFYHCSSCQSNAIVDIDAYSWTSHKHNRYKNESAFTHSRHGESKISREKSIDQGVYLGDQAGKKLQLYLEGV